MASNNRLCHACKAENAKTYILYGDEGTHCAMYLCDECASTEDSKREITEEEYKNINGE